MFDKTAARTSIMPSDIDAQGNVVVWDHGPQSRDIADEATDEQRAAYDATTQAWHEKNGDGPAPLTMHSSDAAHAIAVDPTRYSLEPLVADDDDVSAKVEEIQAKRAEAAKVAFERAEAVQYAADRKVAIGLVMAERSAKAAAAKTAEKPVA